ncbi:MAG: DUF177 domain-containing protein [Clostridiales bacterium]|nr:DUF177 domain-containing protein [Clostridiales bacterium]
MNFLSPVIVSGTYTKIDDDVSIEARLETTAVFNCDRCLTEVKRDFSINILETFFSPSQSGNGITLDGDVYVHNGRFVNLDAMFRERLVLAFPEYVACRVDCKGLCPVCGCDLNVNECDCRYGDDEDRGNQFAVLKDFASGGKNGSTKKKNV